MKRYFILILLLLLVGCGRQPVSEQVESDNESTFLEKSTMVYSMPEGAVLLCMDDTAFYYLVRNTEELGEKWEDTLTFYQQSFDKQIQSVELNIRPDTPIFRDFCACGDRYALLLGTEEEGKLTYLVEIWQDGEVVKQFSLEGIMAERPDRVLFLQEEIVVMSKDSFVTLDSDGKVLCNIASPKGHFMDIVTYGDNRIALAYTEGNDRTTSVLLYQVETKQKKTIAVDAPVSRLFAAKEKLCYIDATGLWKQSIEGGSGRKVVDLSGSNVAESQIVDVRETEKGYRILALTNDGIGAKIIEFFPEGSDDTYPVSEKIRITLYDYAGALPKDSTNPVDAFNEQSDLYEIVVKEYALGKDDKVLEGAKELAEGEYPDLILSPYNKLVEYLLKNQCLVNLEEVIRDMKTIAPEDLSPVVVKAYTKDNSLFALPDQFTLEALYGPESTFGEGTWGVEEFLKWFEEHPHSGGVVCTRKQIYDAFIGAVLEQYIDSGTNEVSFMQDSFVRSMDRFCRLQRKDSYSREEMMERTENISERMLYSISGPGAIAYLENETRETYVIKGYPGTGEVPVVYLSGAALSILNTCECREGAVAFLEYYLRYTAEKLQGEARKNGAAKFYTLEKYLRQGVEELLEADNHLGIPCTYSDEQIDRVMEIVQYAKLKDDSDRELKDLIWEELQGSLDGGRDIQTTCEILQSRVQTFLDER